MKGLILSAVSLVMTVALISAQISFTLGLFGFLVYGTPALIYYGFILLISLLISGVSYYIIYRILIKHRGE